MKILILSHFLPYPPHGGSLQRNYHLFRQATIDNEVHLLSFTQRNILDSEKKQAEAADACRKMFRSATILPIPTDYSRWRWYLMLLANLFSLTPYSVWRFRTRDMVNTLRTMVRDGGFDLIHVDTIALAGYIRYFNGVPAVLNHHNVESSLMIRRGRNERNPLVKLYILFQGYKLRWYEKRFAPQYAANLTVSELDGRELSGFCHDVRTQVIPNGTDIEYFHPRAVEQTRTLIWVGGMNWYPNRDAVVWFLEEIFPLVKNHVPDARVMIIGKNPPPRVTALAAGDPAIQVMGYVDDVRDPVAAAAAFIVPIRVGGGTRLKILDAFANGKAVVSTTIGAEGIGASVGDDILIGDTAEQFAREAARLLSDNQLREQLQASARRFVVRTYAWQIIGSALRACYTQIVQTTRSRVGQD